MALFIVCFSTVTPSYECPIGRVYTHIAQQCLKKKTIYQPNWTETYISQFEQGTSSLPNTRNTRIRHVYYQYQRNHTHDQLNTHSWYANYNDLCLYHTSLPLSHTPRISHVWLNKYAASVSPTTSPDRVWKPWHTKRPKACRRSVRQESCKTRLIVPRFGHSAWYAHALRLWGLLI